MFSQHHNHLLCLKRQRSRKKLDKTISMSEDRQNKKKKRVKRISKLTTRRKKTPVAKLIEKAAKNAPKISNEEKMTSKHELNIEEGDAN